MDRSALGSTGADGVSVGQSAGVGFLSSSVGVLGEDAAIAGTQSVGDKRERTQHTRPAEGLERSVLYNEWKKGWLRYLFFSLSFSGLLFLWLFGVWEGVDTCSRSYVHVLWLF